MTKARRHSAMWNRVGVFVLILLTTAGTVFGQSRGLRVVGREVTGNQSFNIGRQIAVIIGIDRYDEWTPLTNAVSDAQAVKAALEERYYIDEFIELYDEDATAENIRRLFFETIPNTVEREDSLFIFYAGHGYLDAAETGFWIAKDGTTNEYSQSGWIANQQIRNALNLQDAQRVLLIADSCFSGDLLNVSRGASPDVDNEFFAQALQRPARQALTSGASETVPDESEFARSLINLLERSNEPILDPYTMYDRVRRNVTQTLPLFGELPGHDSGGSFAFFLKPQYGTAVVQLQADGTVLLNGEPRGQALAGRDFLIEDLPAGQHEVQITYENGNVETRTIDVLPDERVAVPVAYRPPQLSRLVINAAAEAEVFIGGQRRGTVTADSPLELTDLEVGEYLITLRYQDNQESRSINVVPDITNTVRFTYQPVLLASVRFEGFPDGAAVYSAGREVGVVFDGELVVENLQPGPRLFQVYYERWAEPFATRLDAQADQENPVAFEGGRIVMRGLPADVAIRVNGLQVERTLAERQELDLGVYPAGDYVVSVTGADYEEYRRRITVDPREREVVEPELVAFTRPESGDGVLDEARARMDERRSPEQEPETDASPTAFQQTTPAAVWSDVGYQPVRTLDAVTELRPYQDPYFGYAVGAMQLTALSYGQIWAFVPESFGDAAAYRNPTGSYGIIRQFFDPYPVGGLVVSAGLSYEELAVDDGTGGPYPGFDFYTAVADIRYQLPLANAVSVELGVGGGVGMVDAYEGYNWDTYTVAPTAHVTGIAGVQLRFGERWGLRLDGSAKWVVNGPVVAGFGVTPFFRFKSERRNPELQYFTTESIATLQESGFQDVNGLVERSFEDGMRRLTDAEIHALYEAYTVAGEHELADAVYRAQPRVADSAAGLLNQANALLIQAQIAGRQEWSAEQLEAFEVLVEKAQRRDDENPDVLVYQLHLAHLRGDPGRTRTLWDQVSATSRSYGDVTAGYVTNTGESRTLGEVVKWHR